MFAIALAPMLAVGAMLLIGYVLFIALLRRLQEVK